MPGVQKPHWRPSLSTKAFCNRVNSPERDSPSIVVISAPCASIASSEQALTGLSPNKTVQAPQAARSQASLGPVNPACRRSASSKVVRGSSENVLFSPFTVSEIATGPGPCACSALAWARPLATLPAPSAAADTAVVPNPFRKARRETPEDGFASGVNEAGVPFGENRFFMAPADYPTLYPTTSIQQETPNTNGVIFRNRNRRSSFADGSAGQR